MSWIDKFTDFSICAVEHGINKYKKSKTGKTLEMVLLLVTLFSDDDEVSIEDWVCFVFKDVLQRVFCKYKLGAVTRRKMLLDFLETKNQENFLNYLIKSKGNGNRVFSDESITEHNRIKEENTNHEQIHTLQNLLTYKCKQQLFNIPLE